MSRQKHSVKPEPRLTRPLAALALAAGALAAAAPAQGLPAGPGAAAAGLQPGPELQQPAPDPADDPELARSLRRILMLSDGQAVRGVARFSEGAWEVKAKGEWVRFEARLVRSVALEREVLNEMRRRARAVKDDAPAAEHVALATWMADQGLLAEALEELDDVLEAHPHDADARALLLSRPFVRVPALSPDGDRPGAALSDLFTFGATAPRAVRELTLAELAAAPDRAALEAAALEQLGHGSLRRRSFAAHALGRLFAGEEVRRLILHAVLDPSVEVRREAAFALRASEEPGLIVPIVKALNSTNPRVRTQAAEALGNVGFPAAVEPLVSRLSIASSQSSAGGRVPHSNIFVGRQRAYIQDFDVEVAQFQAVADPQINVLIEGAVLDAGIQGVTAYGFAYESKVIRNALGQLTGESPGYSSRAWLRWWEENQGEWSAARLSMQAAEAAATPAPGDR